jgi:hypothetical protein
VAAKPIDEDNPIEAILLSGFPNPERIGCLSNEVIEGLGQKTIPRDDPAWRHIWNCSPCFKEFKVIRDKRMALVELKQHRQEIFKRSMISLAALVCLAVIVGLFVRHRPPATLEAAVVPINLFDIQTTRGSENLDSSTVLAKLPRKLDELHITLPRFSVGGRYLVGILKDKSTNTAIALGYAVASPSPADRQQLNLVLKLDLSSADEGRYFLATRLEQGSDVLDYYYPVVIEPGETMSGLFVNFAKRESKLNHF